MAGSRVWAAVVAAAVLAGCGGGEGTPSGPATPLDRAARTVNEAGFPGREPSTSGAYDPALLKLQVLLDRARFSPGAIDGRASDNLRRALRAYAAVNRLSGDGALDRGLWNRLTKADPRPAVRTYVIDADDVAGPFSPAIPVAMPAMAALEHLGWRSRAEQLAEAFHMDEALLKALNPGADFRPGSTVLVADRGGDDLDAEVVRVDVSRAGGTVEAYAAGGRLVAAYPATVGSPRCPAPSGSMTVRAIAAQPTYAYDSDSVATAGATRGRTEIAAGPNNPLGAVWIDLSGDGYGLHGAADPSAIGRRADRGCVALANWDARELARGVRIGAVVTFR